MRDDIVINDRALALSDQLIETFETIIDPEIELDMYNLGLIYELNLDENGHMFILMTFTDTNCGCADTMPVEVADKLKQIDGIESVDVQVTYSPVWKMTRISRYGRIFLGISPR
ncbi:metal-sulfur cluster assembly factor [Streptococcus caprae]|uniref:Metal-sulfur cluster assembly factor n=1 Tax=Streptococcus caprae TaxID=1640501 RepID=A0ABV8CXD7_9STRE